MFGWLEVSDSVNRNDGGCSGPFIVGLSMYIPTYQSRYDAGCSTEKPLDRLRMPSLVVSG